MSLMSSGLLLYSEEKPEEFDNFRNEGFLPIKFDENFFLKYCELFNNEDYKKIESTYKIVEFHNKNVILHLLAIDFINIITS